MEKIVNPRNQLLAKDDVGRGKPNTRDLPPEGFTFGKPDRKDPEGASIVTQSWKAHEQSRPKESERDFKKLNKLGVKNGAVDSKEFRKTNDARIDIGKSKRGVSQPPLDQMSFGKPNRPSTPIQGVISNHYGEHAVNEIQDRYIMQHELKKQSKGLPQPKQTKAHEKAVEFIKTKQQGKEEKQEFKLKRFQNVEPRTNTNRPAVGKGVDQVIQ